MTHPDVRPTLRAASAASVPETSGGGRASGVSPAAPALSVTPVEFSGRQLRYELDALWHSRFLRYLNLFCESV